MTIADPPTPQITDLNMSLTHIPTGVQFNIHDLSMYLGGPNYVPDSNPGDVIEAVVSAFAAQPTVWVIESAWATWTAGTDITPTPSETPE